MASTTKEFVNREERKKERKMYRSITRRTVRSLLISSVALCWFVGPLCAAETTEPHETEWALKITEKDFDDETGELRLVLENTSYQTVTAFGVAVVYARNGESGGTQIGSREMLPGEGIAPGALYEMEFDLIAEDRVDDAFRIPALQAVLHYEILSDTTHHGNSAYVEDVFRSRAAYVREVERSLARLQEIRSRAPEKASLEDFWAKESERGREARQILSNPSDALSLAEQARYRAIFNVADLARQMEERSDAAQSVDRPLEEMEWLLRAEYLEPLAEGVPGHVMEKISATEETQR